MGPDLRDAGEGLAGERRLALRRHHHAVRQSGHRRAGDEDARRLHPIAARRRAHHARIVTPARSSTTSPRARAIRSSPAGASTGARTTSSWCRRGPGTSTPTLPSARMRCCSRSTTCRRCRRSASIARRRWARTTAISRWCIERGGGVGPRSAIEGRNDHPPAPRRSARSRALPGRRGRDRHRDHGARSAPRPALRGAAVARRRLRRRGADPAGRRRARRTSTQAARRRATSSRSSISPASISACCTRPSASCRRRSIAPRSPRGSPAPTPTSTASRTWCGSCSGVDLSKQQQLSDWGADALTDAQVAYAASDVLHLHALKEQARRHAGARGARASWPRPASASCPTGSGSTSPAGRPRTFSPIRRA